MSYEDEFGEVVEESDVETIDIEVPPSLAHTTRLQSHSHLSFVYVI